jgi:hypothetical protein
MLLSLAWLSGCGLSHAENNSSGSNWLRCEQLSDCKAVEAVACNAGGYCTDHNGGRIVALISDSKAGQERDSCAIGVDSILNQVPVTTGDRQNCGSFDLDSAAEARVAGLDCFDRAREGGRAAELTVNRCSLDCWIPTTYVATTEGSLYEVFQREDEVDNVREAILQSCGRVALNDNQSDFICDNETKLYQCVEPLSSMPPGNAPQTPFKLSDAPNPDGEPTVTIHLYASNQSFDDPLTSFFVRIDDKRVILGGFAVESQHNWYEFEIEVPLGAHHLDAYGDGGAVFMRDIDISAERWLVIDYWYASGDAKGHYFTLQESDTQVSLQ